MATLGSGEERRKRARSDSSEQTVVEPGQIHAAKKVRLAMDAAETKLGGPAVERVGGEKSVHEGGGLGLQKEKRADRDNNGKDDDICKCIHDNIPMHIDVPQPLCAGRSSTEPAPDDGHMHMDTVQPVCAGKVSNEADPINEDKVIFSHAGKDSKKATLGPRCFTSSTDMLDFFYRLLHGWPLNLNINKYEHMMLEDLLKKGHRECCEKVGTGIKSFQVRINREFSSRCFYVIRKDGSNKDFSYRKCVDNILPLPKLLEPHFHTSNQKEKGSKALLNNKVSKAQCSKTQHNTKGRERMLEKDRGSGRGISRHIQGRGNQGGHGIVNLGGIRRGIRGGQGRGKRGGLGSCIGGAGCKV